MAISYQIAYFGYFDNGMKVESPEELIVGGICFLIMTLGFLTMAIENKRS
jgi:hypothetical protein